MCVSLLGDNSDLTHNRSSDTCHKPSETNSHGYLENFVTIISYQRYTNKITSRFCLTPTVKKTNASKDGEKGSLDTACVDVSYSSHMQISAELNRSIIGPGYPTPENFPEGPLCLIAL